MWKLYLILKCQLWEHLLIYFNTDSNDNVIDKYFNITACVHYVVIYYSNNIWLLQVITSTTSMQSYQSVLNISEPLMLVTSG